jgi:transposase
MTNRIRSLLATQGVRDFAPLRRDSRDRLKEVKIGTGTSLPPHLVNEITRMLDRIAVLAAQLKAVEKERNDQAARSPIAVQLAGLRGIGPEFASVLWLECFYRTFASRRHVAAYSGLAPTPWKSGEIDQEQGISGAGNRKLRQTMIEMAWLWLTHQPRSALSRWYFARVGTNGKGRVKRIAIVALARKLLVALWHYVTDGVVPEGAVLKVA